jgi:putative oxidoreductase
MSTLSTVLAVILGATFVAVAIPKLQGEAKAVANFKRWGYADTIRTAVGAVELLAGAMILVGIAVQSLAVAGSLILIFIMLGALATHSHHRDRFVLWIAPTVLLALDLVFAVSLLP